MFPADARGHMGKQLEQLLQQVTTLRQDTASSRPIRTKSCLLGNNKIQRFAFDMFPADARGYMGKQLEQLLQQVTTLRQDTASSRPIRTKSCLLGNNKIQRFAFDMFPADARGYMGKQLEQLLQQVTTLRQEIASSRPMQTKGCCKGNNYEQRFALDTFPAGCPGEALYHVVYLAARL